MWKKKALRGESQRKPEETTKVEDEDDKERSGRVPKCVEEKN